MPRSTSWVQTSMVGDCLVRCRHTPRCEHAEHALVPRGPRRRRGPRWEAMHQRRCLQARVGPQRVLSQWPQRSARRRRLDPALRALTALATRPTSRLTRRAARQRTPTYIDGRYILRCAHVSESRMKHSIGEAATVTPWAKSGTSVERLGVFCPALMTLARPRPRIAWRVRPGHSLVTKEEIRVLSGPVRIRQEDG
jgi:hypothetical protein